MINLYQGDCLEVLKSFPDNSVEAVVTDPPYGVACKNLEVEFVGIEREEAYVKIAKARTA